MIDCAVFGEMNQCGKNFGRLDDALSRILFGRIGIGHAQHSRCPKPVGITRNAKRFLVSPCPVILSSARVEISSKTVDSTLEPTTFNLSIPRVVRTEDVCVRRSPPSDQPSTPLYAEDLCQNDRGRLCTKKDSVRMAEDIFVHRRPLPFQPSTSLYADVLGWNGRACLCTRKGSAGITELVFVQRRALSEWQRTSLYKEELRRNGGARLCTRKSSDGMTAHVLCAWRRGLFATPDRSFTRFHRLPVKS